MHELLGIAPITFKKGDQHSGGIAKTRVSICPDGPIVIVDAVKDAIHTYTQQASYIIQVIQSSQLVQSTKAAGASRLVHLQYTTRSGDILFIGTT